MPPNKNTITDDDGKNIIPFTGTFKEDEDEKLWLSEMFWKEAFVWRNFYIEIKKLLSDSSDN